MSPVSFGSLEPAARRWATQFVRFATVGLFLVTAVGKSLSLSRPDIRLYFHDPVFPFLSNWQILVVSSGVEVAAVLILLAARSETAWLGLISWLCVLFLMYHAGLLLFGTATDAPCPCLGALRQYLGPPGPIANWIMALVALILGTTSFSLLSWRRTCCHSL